MPFTPTNPSSRSASERPMTESLAELMDEAIIVAGRDGSILEWNGGATLVFGWTPDEAQGMSIHTLQSADAARGLATAVHQVFASNVQWHGETAFLRKGGEAGVCEVVALPIAQDRALLNIRDVTAQRRKLERVSEERHLLRTVMDGIPDVIILKDADGRYVMRNRAHRDLTACPDELVLGRRATDLGFPEELARAYLEDDLAVLRTGKAITNREERFRYPDGKSGWFLTNKYPLSDTSGRQLGLIVVARDITEMKRATDELAEARLQLSRHLDNSLLLVAELDAEQRITRWAGRAEKMFGWSASEAIGRTLTELNAHHPNESENLTEMMRRLQGSSEEHSTLRCRNLTKEGRVIHCLWWNSVLRNADGSVRSFLTLAEEITYTVETLEKLQASDRLLNTLIHATRTGYTQADATGLIVAINEQYLAFFGAKEPADLIGRNYLDFVAPLHREAATRAFSSLLVEGHVRNLELDLLGADGQGVSFECNANAENTSHGKRVHIFYRDISERRRALEERQFMEAKLQETQKLESLGVLAGGIAHDFNNLLTGVLGNASLAAAEIPPGSPAHGFLVQIEQAASRAADLCRQMLAYSGKGRFDVRALDLNALIQETMNLLGISISKRARLDVHFSPSLPSVLADATQLRQIVMNLVINASEAIGEKDGIVRVSTGTVALTAMDLAASHASPDAMPGRYVYFEVNDTGCGMKPDVLKRIFDPFYTTKFTGRGLGLAAVLGIVRGHRGAITVASAPEAGTCFRVLLPATSHVPEAEADPAVPADEWRGSGLVLVVDDEETVRNVATRLLEFLGFQTITASDGAEAVELFMTLGGVRFVFLDLTMPRMDGEETLRALRQLQPDLRVLIMSGFSAQDVATRFGDDALVDFIQKPFSLTNTREKIRRLLD